jgi:hypothetical protein
MGMFQRAETTKAKLRIALAGVSGAGKTYSALVLAKALGGKVALIDSERSSAQLYADLFEFDHLDLTDHAIGKYKAAIKDAAASGYGVLIIDSLSHEWAGRGGALEAVDRKMTQPGQNKFTAWNGVSQDHQGLLDDILAFPGHVIVTMRKKTEYVLETDSKGKLVPRKVGLAPVQREGIEYEFTAMLSLELGGAVIVEKTRCPALEDLGETLRRNEIEKAGLVLRDWLATGKEAPPAKPDEDREKKKGLARARFETSVTEDELNAVWRELVGKMPQADQDELAVPFKARRAAIRLSTQKPAKPNPTPPPAPAPSNGTTGPEAQDDIPF